MRSGKEKLVIKDGSNSSPMETDRGVLYLRNDLRSLADFFVASASGGNERRLSTINQKRLESVGFGDAEPFSFKGAKGDTVYGYVVKPVGLEANQKRRLLLSTKLIPNLSIIRISVLWII